MYNPSLKGLLYSSIRKLRFSAIFPEEQYPGKAETFAAIFLSVSAGGGLWFNSASPPICLYRPFPPSLYGILYAPALVHYEVSIA
jgi:hypothetical protein